MFYVYILVSEKDSSYYVGCTVNIGKRVAMHNSGRVQSTKARRPWQIRYKEEFGTLREARKRESQIKSWHSRKAIERLIN